MPFQNKHQISLLDLNDLFSEHINEKNSRTGQALFLVWM